MCDQYLYIYFTQSTYGFITPIRRSAVDIPDKLTPGFLALVLGYGFFKMLYNVYMYVKGIKQYVNNNNYFK